MGILVKALLILARQYRRIGSELKLIRELYELDCESRGIVRRDYSLKDPVEVAYPGDRRSNENDWG